MRTTIAPYMVLLGRRFAMRNFASVFGGAVCAAILVCIAGGTDANASAIFNFQFDNQGLGPAVQTSDGPIVPPVVGTGTFT